MPAVQFRNICFTCNFCNLVHWNGLPQGVVYAVVGDEVAPTTNQRHFQGYYQFDRKVTLSWYKSNVCSHCHVEGARGTASDNLTYCSKSGKFVVFGKPKVQGHRSDLDVITTEVRERPLISVMQDYPSTYIRNYRGIKDFICGVVPPRERQVRQFYGKYKGMDDVYVMSWDDSLREPTPYHGQSVCCVYEWGKFELLKNMICDGTPCFIAGVPCNVVEVYYPRAID